VAQSRGRALASGAVSDQIAALHPEIKRKPRAAVDDVLQGRERGKPLRENLSGLFSVRLGKFRLILRPHPGGDLEIVAFGPRASVYEEVARLMRSRRRGP
jgi:mRNA-degrading endonuclease RelE of RelBE toxin-antitoxin system